LAFVQVPSWNTQYSCINPVEIVLRSRKTALDRSHCRERQANSGEKFLVVEWLGKKSGSAGFERGGTHERIVFSSKHDDACGWRKLPHSRLNLKPVHERHPNINDGDRRSMKFYVSQKRLRIAELFGVPAYRHEKPVKASQYGGIVVQQTDQSWAWSIQNKSTLGRRSMKPY